MSSNIQMSSNTSELEVIKINDMPVKAEKINIELSNTWDTLHLKSPKYNGKVYEIILLRDNHWIHLDRYGYSRAANTAPYMNMVPNIPGGFLLPPMMTYVYLFSNNDNPSDSDLAKEKFKEIISYVIENPVPDAFESLLKALKSDVTT